MENMEHNFQIKPTEIKFDKLQANNPDKNPNSKKALKAVKNNENVYNTKDSASSTIREDKKKNYSVFKKVEDIKINAKDHKVKLNIKNKTSNKNNEFVDTKEEKRKLNYMNKYQVKSDKKNETKKENCTTFEKKVNGQSIKINNNKNQKCNSTKYLDRNNTQKVQNSKINPEIIRIKDDDTYLKDLVKKKNICIQSEKCDKNNKENENAMFSGDSTLEDSSQEDIHSLDLIEQYKKKKKKELETKRKKLTLYKKSKLIKKATFKNAETQVFLDDFYKYYEKVKPEIDKIVECVLNKALQELYEEQEVKKIKSEIDFYENLRQTKFQSLKKYEKLSEDFYDETQTKIKNRIKLKEKVEFIMKKKVANRKAQKNVHYIFQKNLDLYSLMDALPNNFEKNINLIILPWICEYIYYLVNVKKEIVHHIINGMIEQSVTSSTETYEKLECFNKKRNGKGYNFE